MKKLTILLLFPVFINAQDTTRSTEVLVLENKDTLIRTVTQISELRYFQYTTNSYRADTIRKKYVPVIPNVPPVSKAGNDFTITLPALVTLRGSGTDTDGTISGYSWSRISGPTSFTFENQFAASTNVTNLVAGTYTFRLTVTDNKGSTAYDDVIVIVKSAPVSTGQSLIKIDGWNSYVHLPANYNSTTVTYPTIIFFPGLGEVGTTASLAINNGPGAYITQGWNGNVTVDGGTVEFIVISLQPPAAYPNEVAINAKIKAIKSLYRVDPARLYLTGLSHGGWCSSTFVTGDPLGGPYTYASQVAAVVEVQGVTPNDNTPYPDLFDNFVKSGGKFLGFEQRLDNRGVPTRVSRMNATVPGSAIYMQTNFGTGGHCCWENFYGGKGVQPGNFLLGGVNQSLYQWMARQSLKTVPVPPTGGGNGGSACNTLPPKTWVVGPTQPGEIYIKDASAKGWRGGDTLKILAGTYSVIEIDSFRGDPCRPIIIINEGGLVNVTGSIRLQADVRYVRFLGSGTPGIPYGFKCKNFAINRFIDFWMERIECGPNLPDATGYKGGVGIYAKQDPYTDKPWTQYGAYASSKLTINNCYVHDVDGEGMYIGHTAPDGDPYNSQLTPQRMDSVTISNNIVERTGWDAIQLSNARSGNKIFGNRVSDFGKLDIDGQRAGIISGSNTQSDVYNNTITNGTGNGIQFFGYGKMNCYGNTITNVGNTLTHVDGEETFFGNAYRTDKIEPTNPRQGLYIHNNQINQPKNRGIVRVWDNNNSEPINFSNNKICTTETDLNKLIFLATNAIKNGNTISCN